MHSTGKCDEQNILKLKLALLFLSIRLQLNSWQFQICIKKNDLLTGVEVTFIVCYIYRHAWKTHNFQFLLLLSHVHDTFPGVPQPLFTCIYHFSFAVSLEMEARVFYISMKGI